MPVDEEENHIQGALREGREPHPALMREENQNHLYALNRRKAALFNRRQQGAPVGAELDVTDGLESRIAQRLRESGWDGDLPLTRRIQCLFETGRMDWLLPDTRVSESVREIRHYITVRDPFGSVGYSRWRGERKDGTGSLTSGGRSDDEFRADLLTILPLWRVALADAPAPEVRANTTQKARAEDRALGVFVQHPDWTNQQIADEAGVHVKTLSSKHCERYRCARAMVREGGRAAIPQGRKDGETGTLDAWEREH